ncbi:MAG: SurA N-terminal domain-containing protein [Simkaniaceae bacterium]|nr:SurA N-terminal domain-containing protein [Simkaniaceae bacterium]
MKRIILALALAFGTLAASDLQIAYNNRIVAKVGDKNFSLLDVVKKMDVLLLTHDPETFETLEKRYQFYMSQWKHTLKEMIDDELILHDSESKEYINVSDGDVREEISNRFGPNILTNLNKVGLTHETAQEMIRSELIVRQMSWFRAYAKAMTDVTPNKVKHSYTAFLKEHPPKEEWTYQMLSIRGEDESLCEQAAKQAQELITKGSTFDSVAEKLSSDRVIIKASNDFTVDNKSISDAHKKVLSSLPLKTFSSPVAEKSRRGQGMVYRIYNLKEHTITNPPAFEKVADRIKDNLLNIAADKRKREYVETLKSDSIYDDEFIKEMTPPDYQPFALVSR